MRILIFIIGFLFLNSAATLAAEKVVLTEGDSLTCTKRALTHMNYLELDDFGHPNIITTAKDDMKKEYENWLKKRHQMDVVSTYNFTTSENDRTVIASHFIANSRVFIKNIDDEYVPEKEHSQMFFTNSAYLVFYKNDNEHYFAHVVTPKVSWVDMCVLYQN